MKPNFDSESDGEDVVTSQRKAPIIDSESDGEPAPFANEEVGKTSDNELQSLTADPKENDDEYDPEIEENFVEEETQSMSKAERKKLKKRKKKREKRKLMKELYARIVAGEDLEATEGLSPELIEQIKDAMKYEQEKLDQGVSHGNHRKRKVEELDEEDGLLDKPRKRRKISKKASEKKEKEKELNEFFEVEKIRRHRDLNSLVSGTIYKTSAPKGRGKLLNLLTNISVKSPIVKTTKTKKRKLEVKKNKTPMKSPSGPGMRLSRKDSFTVTKQGTQTDLGVTSKLRQCYVEKKIPRMKFTKNSPALKQRNKMKDKLARTIAKVRRKAIKKHQREFGKEEDYMQHAEDSLLAETLQSQMDLGTPKKKPPEEPDEEYAPKSSDSDDSDADDDEVYTPTLGSTPQKSQPDGNSADLEEESQDKALLQQSPKVENISSQNEEVPILEEIPTQTQEKVEPPEKMEIEPKEMEGDADDEEESDDDAENIDLEKILKKKELDEEDEALLRLMGHGVQEMDAEAKAFLDIEAVDEDEEAAGVEAQDEHEKKFGVVKNLLAKKKVKETTELRKQRLQLDAIHRDQQDEAEQEFFERVFIDGEINLVNKKREHMEGTGEMNFICRDKALGENPEDYIVSDDEMNNDCYDENGHFLPVWKIRLNRARREKLKQLDADFFSSDEDEDMEGLSKEEKLARKKARFEEKMRKGVGAKKNKEADKFFGPEQTEEDEDVKQAEKAKKAELNAKKKREPIFKRARSRVPKGLMGRISRLASECDQATPKKHSAKAFIFSKKDKYHQSPEETIVVEKPQAKQTITKKPKLFASLSVSEDVPKLGRSFDRRLVKQLTIE